MTAIAERTRPRRDPALPDDVVLGRILIADRVVEKIAAQAVLEIPDAGGAAPRVLGHAIPGAGHLGIRRTGLHQAPRATADVDGATVHLDLTISVRWPASVSQVTTRVRDHVRTRIHDLTGLSAAEIRIAVTGLITGPSEGFRS
jgi:uncharacterized alkaline shock family protein YloU